MMEKKKKFLRWFNNNYPYIKLTNYQLGLVHRYFKRGQSIDITGRGIRNLFLDEKIKEYEGILELKRKTGVYVIVLMILGFIVIYEILINLYIC